MRFSVVAIVCGLLSTSCVPTIVMIDRTTLIEEESSGAWPDFDAQLNKQATGFQPSVLPPSETDKRSERAYQVINGDYSLAVPSQK